MDIFAEVIDHGERTGLLGYREDLWRKRTGMDKRLVLKLFNETLNWRASMDLMIGRSLQLTLGARGLPVTAFSINAGEHDDVVYLERSANKWPLAPEHFSFFLLDDGRPQFYRLKRDVIDLGGDYTLFSHRNEVVGRLDGKVFTLGGKWRGRVHPDHVNPRLLAVLQLFCGMLIFNGSCRRHVRQLARDVRAGRYEPKIEKQESDLYMNPRRVRWGANARVHDCTDCAICLWAAAGPHPLNTARDRVRSAAAPHEAPPLAMPGMQPHPYARGVI